MRTKLSLLSLLACFTAFSYGLGDKYINQVELFSEPSVNEAMGLSQRLLGDKSKAFVFEKIEASDKFDIFEIESKSGKIVIRGNTGVSIASGLNYYLTNCCGCQISLNYNQLALPKVMPAVEEKITKKTPFEYRNFFNYCTFGYTMPWWSWEQWEKMIDYMALHGVNAPLAITGQESVWQEVFRDMGLSEQQIADFFVGPAHLPWGWMANIDGLCGPLPENWFVRQKELQTKILARERALGMTPILQAFAGHVPAGIKEKYPDAKIHQVTDWACMPGTYLLDPMDPLFSEIGKRFIDKQTEMYGTDHLYNADCFNEVNPHTNDPAFIAEVGKSVYSSMTSADPDAIWVFQGWFLFWQQSFWQKPQASALLSAVPHDRMIGLDLYCERNPVWDKTEGFYGKKWIWNVLCNQGQKVNLSGNLKAMDKNLQEAMASEYAGQLSGIGVMMEGFKYNPIVQNYVLSKTWSPEATDFPTWIENYATCRYGMESDDAKKAWTVLLESGPYCRNILGESNICYTPNLSDKLADEAESLDNQMAGQESIRDGEYSPEAIKLALTHLLACSDELKEIKTYQFDVVHLTREMLVNEANKITTKMNNANAKKDADTLRKEGDKFLALIMDMDEICGTNEVFMLGKWLSDARQCGTTEEESNYYESNARTIITMWQPSKNSCLRDYASKQWNGLLRDFYYVRWERYLNAKIDAIKSNTTFDRAKYVDDIKSFELDWINSHNHYSDKPSGDPILKAKELLEKYEN